MILVFCYLLTERCSLLVAHQMREDGAEALARFIASLTAPRDCFTPIIGLLNSTSGTRRMTGAIIIAQYIASSHVVSECRAYDV